jgi:hypothetical protein
MREMRKHQRGLQRPLRYLNLWRRLHRLKIWVNPKEIQLNSLIVKIHCLKAELVVYYSGTQLVNEVLGVGEI